MSLACLLAWLVLAPQGLAHRLTAEQNFQSRLIITLSGRELASRSAQDGLMFAVPWRDLVSQLFPQRDIQVLVEHENQGVLENDARNRLFDPERARFLLARSEFGLPAGLKLRCEPNVCHVANWLVQFLRAVGIYPPPTEVIGQSVQDHNPADPALLVRLR